MTYEHNPYDFVPLEEGPTYIANPPLHRSIKGLCGSIVSEIEILTPLCIHQDPGRPTVDRRYRFAYLDNNPLIPATSFKGMLRGVHEVVTNSTMGMLQSKKRGGWYRENVPDRENISESYLPDVKTKQLTSTEALFGRVIGERDERERGVPASSDEWESCAGRLLLRDIPIAVDLRDQAVSRPRGGQPKPAHRSFYFRPDNGKILGRKFYYHQQDYQRVLTVYRRERGMDEIIIESVPSGTRLVGNLRFFNLDPLELAQLVYTLVLEDDLAHKLGYGKPLGLGSVRLKIKQFSVERLEQNGVPSRFFSYGEPTTDDWIDRVGELRETARNNWLERRQGSESYRAFTAIAQWPQQKNFLYPEYGYFRDQRGTGTQMPLHEYQERDHLYAARQVPIHAAPAQEVAQINRQEQPSSPQPILTSIDLRPVGQIEDSLDIGPFVRSEDGRRYRLISESAPMELLRSIVDQLKAGTSSRVRYRPDRRKIDKKYQSVAVDVEPFQEEA